MAGTNNFVTFDFENFADYACDGFPRGTLLSFGVNPFNGLVVMKYQDDELSLKIASDLLLQVCDDVVFNGLSDFVDFCRLDSALSKFDCCPFCGGVPRYVTEQPVPVHESHSGLYPGRIVCCDGRTVIDGFASKLEAVQFWNQREQGRVS